MKRRDLLAAGAASLIAPWANAQSQAWPTRGPIRLICQFPPGGLVDTVARLIAPHLQQALSQTVLVENRPGAGGLVGTDFAARQNPDGYSLLVSHASVHVYATATRNKMPFDAIADFTHMAMLVEAPMVLLVHNDSPFRNATDLIAAAKKNPDRYTHGSAGVGSIAHLSMEEFAYLAQIKLVHVPYKGSSLAMNDLLGGNVDLLLSTSTFTAPYVKSKRVRALGVAGDSRLSILPDVPTFEEQGVKDFNVVDSKSMGGPRGIPPEVVALLNAELNNVLKDRAVYTRLEDEGTTAVGGSPEYMLQLVRKDIARWKKVIELQKITPQ